MNTEIYVSDIVIITLMSLGLYYPTLFIIEGKQIKTCEGVYMFFLLHTNYYIWVSCIIVAFTIFFYIKNTAK